MLIRLLLICLALFTVEAHAVDDGDWWLQREIKLAQNREDYAKRVYGRSARSFLETDPVTAKSKTVTKIAIAESVPTASKVGSTMLQRVAFYARNPGVQMIGVYAVTQLIEGIGWVMDEGSKSYVKYKPTNQSCQNIVYAQNGGKANTTSCTVRDSCLLEVAYLNKVSPSGKYAFKSSSENPKDCTFTWVDGSNAVRTGHSSISIDKNPNYDPNAQKTKIPLTPELLGAAMLGEGYDDPVDPTTYNPIANRGQMDQSVANAYEHDPTGVGDDLAKEMDDKIKNAPPTLDGQPAPFGDPRYKTPPTTDKPNKNDRAWGDDGAAADGKAEPIKDPDGNPTGGQSISFTFPVFCEWAFTVCKWYDDWKKTDEWMKDKPELKDEKLEVENEDIQTYHRQDSVVFGKTCPFNPERVSIPMGLIGSIDFDKDLTFFCTYGEQAAPYIQGLGYLGSLIFLMLGLRNGNA
ncbi:hypothetical protein [Acinetobacter nosocomialis]|uniref:Uncharacterized protein n=1 Tax=Acinetobacter nosocomialis TaxID=106654 RepID=A0A836MG97_ACINO|nr:hypothetical protein [Acinetobacter nosocomialis]KDM51469.1 hypothetical protein AE32_03961 [Acinetobacter nosocomialis]